MSTEDLPRHKPKDHDYHVHLRDVLRVTSSNQLRCTAKGNLYSPVKGTTYAYEYATSVREFLQLDFYLFDETLLKRIEGALVDRLPPVPWNLHFFGFIDGVLDIRSCEFTPKGQVPPSLVRFAATGETANGQHQALVVRKYYERNISGWADNPPQTPIFDEFVRLQGVPMATILKLTGRLFFDFAIPPPTSTVSKMMTIIRTLLVMSGAFGHVHGPARGYPFVPGLDAEVPAIIYKSLRTLNPIVAPLTL